MVPSIVDQSVWTILWKIMTNYNLFLVGFLPEQFLSTQYRGLSGTAPLKLNGASSEVSCPFHFQIAFGGKLHVGNVIFS